MKVSQTEFDLATHRSDPHGQLQASGRLHRPPLDAMARDRGIRGWYFRVNTLRISRYGLRRMCRPVNVLFALSMFFPVNRNSCVSTLS